MFKKVILLALALIMCLSTIITTFAVPANDRITVTVDGQPVVFTDQEPVIIDGRTLVPVRGVFEQLGFDVAWHNATRQAELSNADNIILITIDSNIFTTNGINHTLDVPAQIINGRTMLPLRAVLESVGYGLDWDGATRTVIITAGENQGSAGTVTQLQGTPTATPSPIDPRIQELLDNSSIYIVKYEHMGHIVFALMESASLMENHNVVDMIRNRAENPLDGISGGTDMSTIMFNIEVRANGSSGGSFRRYQSNHPIFELLEQRAIPYMETAAPTSTSTPQNINISDFERRIFELTNAERAKVGVAPLIWNDCLALAARLHSEDILAHNLIGHSGSDGSYIQERALDAGFLGLVSENVTSNGRTPEEAVESWMNSPGHRAQILNPENRTIGIGVAFGPNGMRATQKFSSNEHRFMTADELPEIEHYLRTLVDNTRIEMGFSPIIWDEEMNAIARTIAAYTPPPNGREGEPARAAHEQFYYDLTQRHFSQEANTRLNLYTGTSTTGTHIRMFAQTAICDGVGFLETHARNVARIRPSGTSADTRTHGILVVDFHRDSRRQVGQWDRIAGLTIIVHLYDGGGGTAPPAQNNTQPNNDFYTSNPEIFRELERQYVEKINAIRRENGLNPLVVDEELTSITRMIAADRIAGENSVSGSHETSNYWTSVWNARGRNNRATAGISFTDINNIDANIRGNSSAMNERFTHIGISIWPNAGQNSYSGTILYLEEPS